MYGTHVDPGIEADHRVDGRAYHSGQARNLLAQPHLSRAGHSPHNAGFTEVSRPTLRRVVMRVDR